MDQLFLPNKNKYILNKVVHDTNVGKLYYMSEWRDHAPDSAFFIMSSESNCIVLLLFFQWLITKKSNLNVLMKIQLYTADMVYSIRMHKGKQDRNSSLNTQDTDT